MTQYLHSNVKDRDLFKEFLDIDSDEDTSEIDKMCLITMTPLDENHVTLDCGHTFNYTAIFKDIYNHKKKFSRLERCQLSSREIRCPYCRNVQRKLLPVKPGAPLVYGVNTLNDRLHKITRKMKNTNFYPHIFHTYMSGMCCHGMCPKKVLLSSDGFTETDVVCNNTKVMYNNMTGLVYCPEHNISATNDMIEQELTRLSHHIEQYKEFVDNNKGSKKQTAKRKMNALTLVYNNMKEEQKTLHAYHVEKQAIMCVSSNTDDDKTNSSNDNEGESDNEWETPMDYTNKYNSKCRCFAFYTTGAKKNTRCENVRVGNKLYCNMHPYIQDTL